MSTSSNGFAWISFVPPDEDHMVIEVDWMIDGVAFAIAEVAHDPGRDIRTLTYWVSDRHASLPFFDFMEALARANVIAHREPATSEPFASAGGDLHVGWDGPGSISLTGEGDLVVARVRIGAEGPKLEVWEPDSASTISVPFYGAMEALFEASVRLDRYATF